MGLAAAMSARLVVARIDFPSLLVVGSVVKRHLRKQKRSHQLSLRSLSVGPLCHCIEPAKRAGNRQGGEDTCCPSTGCSPVPALKSL